MKLKAVTWALFLLWLIYFISPYDLLPDFIARPLSWLDDILIGYFLWRWRNYLRNIWSKLEDGPKSHTTQAEEEASSRNTSEQTHFDPYRILEVSRDASKEEIDKSYKALVNKYHPDKVNHLGEEFKQMAHEKMILIQRAYAELKR